MSMGNLTPTRRRLLAGGAAAFGAAPAILSGIARAADKDFNIGIFLPLSGPAALFGPTGRACAELAADEINKAGGILGRQVRLLPTDGGTAPAEAAKSAVRLMLEEKVDMLLGSHDSAVRGAIATTVKGKVPYVYTPVYEGGECSPNIYCLGETPDQQGGPAIGWLATERKARTYYLIGNDYGWPRKTNERARRLIADQGGSVIAEEYLPLGAPNKFEEAVTRIKAARPDVVLITLVGADNVNFNRTFAGFGLDRDIARFAFLLEENTLAGIGADASRELYACMGYFADLDWPTNRQFKAAYAAKFVDKAPALSTIGVDSFTGIKFARALVEKAKGTDARACMAASEGLRFDTVTAPAIMRGRHVDKTMFLARCQGTKFEVIKTFGFVPSGTACGA
ncbi:MAG: substrate-binding domain-containing protein [Ferrovibrionaceae bacterium]